MDKKEFKALVSLLDDDDEEIIAHVEKKIVSLGNQVIPYLEEEWENNFNTETQRRIEDLIHTVQFDVLKEKLIAWKTQKNKDLLEGMALVASYQYPDVDVNELRKDLEQIYYEAWLQFKPDVHPFDQIKILNSVLFGKLKFGANNKNFHSPGNSMINVVLQTKKGNPLTLCVIYMLVAQKLKLPVYGVNLPNLFILTHKTKEVQFYINAFNRGLIFTKEDIDKYISELYLTQKDSYYQPCSEMDIIRRVLKNLVFSFEKIGDHYKSEEIKILINALGESE
ncbi:transglutaminase-like domain-containing protein [Fulvivirgaceae bacterium BMA12]|uniref:Transglutaminase-like domain-containing protein n=1 Tax=Agaribacillus aureus TaxID=3051825 RepID=A0ABT8LG80_9BACT|nr:transglutaminase-like domain-containing protein [Fulvivirgaceae bacterium BMA12]